MNERIVEGIKDGKSAKFINLKMGDQFELKGWVFQVCHINEGKNRFSAEPVAEIDPNTIPCICMPLPKLPKGIWFLGVRLKWEKNPHCPARFHTVKEA